MPGKVCFLEPQSPPVPPPAPLLPPPPIKGKRAGRICTMLITLACWDSIAVLRDHVVLLDCSRQVEKWGWWQRSLVLLEHVRRARACCIAKWDGEWVVKSEISSDLSHPKHNIVILQDYPEVREPESDRFNNSQWVVSKTLYLLNIHWLWVA